ncbi:putative FAD binding domain protein [Neofusicoccum parvum]|uniref:FAD binding domain protein n=1 Tax=Neofusicoccum parvum TaxID=310453 RepID=A0ACB5SHA9_9PEZI|nr:putative FAD binding domain protein [Neofusicoccum parvum]
MQGLDRKYFAFGDPSTPALTNSTCKAFPGDSAWPSADVWHALDEATNHALIETVPSAHACYSSEYGAYDAAQCAHVAANWNNSYFHADDPTSVSWPLFQGRTCLPTGVNVTSTCTLGGYPSYVVNATTSSQIQAAVNFARNAGVRLVVKNTGHDFAGKSAGAGALSVWTHHLKDIRLIEEYVTPSWRGPAVQVGSGVQAGELYAWAEENGLTVVGGECESVGVTGGYILGGGHSPLSSIYGMGADHVLALNVILPSGQQISATETLNTALFWALRGGGGSTFGVVTSVTLAAHPRMPVATTTLSFSTSATVPAATFWAGVRAYFDHFLALADAGTYAYFWVIPLGSSQFLFQLRPLFAPNHTAAQATALLVPWLAQLRALSIPVAPNTTAHASFHAAWRAGFATETVGNVDGRSGSRLFPRANFETREMLDATFAALRGTTEAGVVMLAFNMRNAAPAGAPPSAVSPHWRRSYLHACAASGWAADASVEEVRAAFDYLTYDVFGRWRAVSPTSGAYMNEADLQEPDWQDAFFGRENYGRLLELKREVDPWGLFYAPTAVGSESWEVRTADGLPTQDGRLCRKA